MFESKRTVDSPPKRSTILVSFEIASTSAENWKSNGFKT
jgi:hypothetical protein